MRSVVAAVAVLLILVVLWDVFETIVLPRRVTRRFRPTRLVYRLTWIPWAAVARRLPSDNRRETFLGYYGPLALIALLGAWAVALIVGFAAVQWALGPSLTEPPGSTAFGTTLYFSATTFITVGLGDVTPISGTARVVTALNAAAGFGLLALVIGYMPALYQAFSRREVSISLLDARAGSPPSAGELLRRYSHGSASRPLDDFLREWEHWSAELLESHLSYPSLAYFRSQHDNQSWLAALTVILDVCALVLSGIGDVPAAQARLTFAMARHAAVDLSQVLETHPHEPEPPRLDSTGEARLRDLLAPLGPPTRDPEQIDAKLTHLRQLYEPYVHALAHHLLMPLPRWLPREDAQDDWQTSAHEHMVET